MQVFPSSPYNMAIKHMIFSEHLFTCPEQSHSLSNSTYSFSLLYIPSASLRGFLFSSSWNFRLDMLSKSFDKCLVTYVGTEDRSGKERRERWTQAPKQEKSLGEKVTWTGMLPLDKISKRSAEDTK